MMMHLYGYPMGAHEGPMRGRPVTSDNTRRANRYLAGYQIHGSLPQRAPFFIAYSSKHKAFCVYRIAKQYSQGKGVEECSTTE